MSARKSGEEGRDTSSGAENNVDGKEEEKTEAAPVVTAEPEEMSPEELEVARLKTEHAAEVQ